MKFRAQLCPALLFFATLALPWQVSAVLFDVTGDPSYHTNAPTGALTNSGWQLQGQFGAYLGTPIDPHYFLTAQHLFYYSLVSTNTPFVLDGTNYTVVSFTNAPLPGSDLTLCRVAQRLPRYAPVYTGSNEVGATIAVFGRGTQRGAAVVTDGLTNGWLWGATDNVQRWGSNRVEGIVFDAAAPLLYADFNHGAGPDECHLSDGDSGGADFILADGTWQLAGIHFSVDAYFNATNQAAGQFNAAIYDADGLYYGEGTNWVLITNHVARSFYSSRVSAYYAWLTSVIPDFDSNANGLPDWWEQQYSGGIHGLSATNDLDGDGFSNLAEWIARTDPTNPASFFRTAAITCTGSVTKVTFTGWSDRVYQIYRHDAPLTSGSWTLVTTNAFAGADGPTTWTDTIPSATSRFYRLSVSLPP